MAYSPPAHEPYQWQDAPSTNTPLDAAHLEAAEDDLVTYTQTVAGQLGAYTDAETARAEAAEGELIPLAQKGAANGVAALDSTGKLPSGQLPTLTASSVGADPAGAAASAQSAAEAASDPVGAAAAAQAASLQKANNLSDLPNAATARASLGLGSAATQPSTAFDAAGLAASLQAAILSGLALQPTRSTSGALTANTRQPVSNAGSASAITFTLPTTGTVGQAIVVEREDDGTLNTAGAIAVTGTVRGAAASLSLVLLYESLVFVYEGSGSWGVFAGHKTLGSLDSRYTIVGATGPGVLPTSTVTRSWVPPNVMDPLYGAKGDGVTVDTAAVQAAVTFAAARYAITGSITDVLLPAGYKFLIGQITVSSGVRVWAYGATITPTLNASGAIPFNGWLFIYPAHSSPQILSNFEIRGGNFVGTGKEITNNGVFGNGASTGVQDVVIRDTTVTNWGMPPYYFLNPTRVKTLTNTIIANDINNGYLFQNEISFDFDGTAPASGHILADGNIIHNACADAIAVVVTGSGSPTVLNYTVTNNIITADPPTADNACTFNSTATVASPNASTASVGKMVTGPGIPRATYVVSVVAGTSYTLGNALGNAYTYTGSGTLYVGVYKNTIALEIDQGAGSSATPFSNAIIANNQVQGYERVLINLQGSARNMVQVLVKGNVINNGQIGAATNWAVSNQQGSGIGLLGNTPDSFDVTIEGNYVSCASPVAPIGRQIGANTGRQVNNKFSLGPASGTVTLAGGSATISTTEVQSGDIIMVGRQSGAGALGELSVGTITAGTSFVISSSSASDASTVYWEIRH